MPSFRPRKGNIDHRNLSASWVYWTYAVILSGILLAILLSWLEADIPLIGMAAAGVGGLRVSVLTRSWQLAPMQAYRAALSQNAPKFLAKPRSFHSSAHRAATQSAIPHISLHIAASSSGKGRKFLNQNTLEFDPSEKVEQGVQKGRSIAERKRGRPDSGQDAFFIAKVGEEDEQLAFGIADGVGGWTSSGVDPADFAHGLCSYMAVSALRAEHVDTPRNLLQKGYNDVHQDRSIPAGGSTACIAIASTKGFVQIANLGDSGFLHLRRGAVHDLSSPQLHSFNTPYQLSVIPQHLLVQSAIFGGAPLSDQPSHADQFKQQLQHGDVLVLASDGVWDNLNAQDVLDIVCREMQKYGAWTETISEGIVVSEEAATLVKPGSVGGKHIASRTLQGVLAGAIAGEAKIASMNNKRDGPFAKEVQRYFPNENWHGGKVDDISVLVLISIQEQNPGDTELD